MYLCRSRGGIGATSRCTARSSRRHASSPVMACPLAGKYSPSATRLRPQLLRTYSLPRGTPVLMRNGECSSLRNHYSSLTREPIPRSCPHLSVHRFGFLRGVLFAGHGTPPLGKGCAIHQSNQNPPATMATMPTYATTNMITNWIASTGTATEPIINSDPRSRAYGLPRDGLQ